MKFLLSLLLLCLEAFSQPAQSKEVTFNFGALMRTHQIYHGVLTFDGISFFPGISVNFYNKVYLRGPNIEYVHSNFSLGTRYFNDSVFALATKDQKERNEFRDIGREAFDIYLRKQFDFTSRIRLQLQFDKELLHHHGHYFYMASLVKVLPLTRIGTGVGVGDKAHHQAMYGPSARSGTGHQDFLINVVYPSLPYKGFLMLSFQQILTHYSQNRRAEFVKESDHPKVLSMIASWPL